jgi:D-alanyl-D-alanine carboxypeptidase/D-alanyl-D-alanine-endopeptidase (penicillin-binding protein 4)
LEPLLATLKGQGLSAVVLDATTGDAVYGIDTTTPRVPASTLKILTALTALDALGEDAVLTTSVVVGSGSDIVLVGGGDPTIEIDPQEARGPLRPASLTDLAQKTVDALGTTTTVNLVYDDGLFAAPYLNPEWPTDYPDAGVVAPITALMINGGRVSPDIDSRLLDPAAAAAKDFAGLLAAKGIQIGEVRAGTAPPGAVELARVTSPTVGVLVQKMLTDSDNTLAECLAHVAGAKATGTGSFASGAAATLAHVRELGLPVDGMALTDGSGLARSNLVSVATLGGALAIIAQGAEPSTWPVLPGLPVAGLTGTLADRFKEPPADLAAGLVRAKTGTLSEVVGLAGLVSDADGRILTFAFIADATPDVDGTRSVFDQAAAAVTQCGCRGPAA